jgi:hypothetical protein
MNKLQIMQRIYEMNEAFNAGRIADLVLLSGLTENMVQHMSMEEVMEAVSVRLADMMKTVGMNNEYN